MKANKTYWQGAPKVDELIYVVYKNPSTMVEDLKAGRIAAAHNIPAAEFKQLEKNPDIRTLAFTFFNWDYIDYNCYQSADSLGNPVLKDVRFRIALDTAIDRDKLVAIAYGGEAVPGTTILPPDNWRDPDYHWQPPAGVLRTFDLAKAGQMLDEAGYKDTDGDGLRDYKGKPIKLRLWALNSNTQAQSAAKLTAGWFKDLGLTIEYEVVDEGVYNDRIWNYKGDTYAPDYDMLFWTWYGYADPGQTLDSYTTAQIENWNEPCWSSAEYDQAIEDQTHALDPAERKAVHRQGPGGHVRRRPDVRHGLPEAAAGHQHQGVGRLDLQRDRRRPGVLPLRQPEELPDRGAGHDRRERGRLHHLDLGGGGDRRRGDRSGRAPVGAAQPPRGRGGVTAGRGRTS